MTPEEHFDQAEKAAQSFADSHDEVDARWAEVCTALGRAKSEHESRKAFAAERETQRFPLMEVLGSPAWPLDKVKEQAEEIENLKKRTSSRARLIDDLHRQIAEAQDAVERLTKERNRAQTNELVLEEREKQVAQRDLQITGLRAQVNELGDKLYKAGAYRAQCEDFSAKLANRLQEVTELKQENDALVKKLAKFTSKDQPTPLTDGLPDVPEGFFRLVVDAPNNTDLTYTWPDGRVKLVDPSTGASALVHALRAFKRNGDELPGVRDTPPFPYNMTKWKR